MLMVRIKEMVIDMRNIWELDLIRFYYWLDGGRKEKENNW